MISAPRYFAGLFYLHSMKKLNLLTFLFLFVSQLPAQNNQPLDSFFRYYCNMYKSFLLKSEEKKFQEVMSNTSLQVYNPKNTGILSQATNYIKQHYKIKDDKEAIIRLLEINSERFIKEQLVNLTSGKATRTYDSLYRLSNAFLCDCITGKIKGKSQEQLNDNDLKEATNCYQQLESSPNAMEIRKFFANMDPGQRKAAANYIDLRMCAQCSGLTRLMIKDQINDFTEVYGRPENWSPYKIMEKVEKYVQKTDTITTIERYFTSETAYKESVSQLNLWRRALQLKDHGLPWDYRYSRKDPNEYCKLYTTEKKRDPAIAFMIKYEFTPNGGEKKIVSIIFLEADKVPGKEKVLKDFQDGRTIGDPKYY